MRKGIDKRTLSAAFTTSLPIMVTFIVLGTGYGLLMEKHGFGPLWSLASGIIIFSGTVQFVSVGFLSGGPVLMAGITALMVAARHFFFSISMIGRYRNEGKRKWYLYYALCDETYAMLSRDDIPKDINLSMYRLLVTFFDQSAWLTGSVLGGLLGGMLTFNSQGIDFAMTALFTTVYVQQWIDSKCHIPAVLGVAATLACRLAFGRDYFLIPAMVVIIAVLTIMRSRIEPQFGEAVAATDGDAAAGAVEAAAELPQEGGGSDE
jgi:4-azaleucine resistance transporter AzlC